MKLRSPYILPAAAAILIAGALSAIIGLRHGPASSIRPAPTFTSSACPNQLCPGRTPTPTQTPTPTPTPTPKPTPTPTPTRTRTPTPTPRPAPRSLPSPPGSWPNAANTGYPHGLSGDSRTPVSLGPVQGVLTITKSGTYTGLNVRGTVLVQANSVTIKDSYIDSQGGWGVLLGTSSACNTGLLVVDTEINGGGSEGFDPTTAAVNQYNYCKPDGTVVSTDPLAWTCERCNIHDNEDGVKLTSRNLLQDSYIHNLFHPTSTHHSDGFQLSDGAWSYVLHNTIAVGVAGEPYTDGSAELFPEIGWGGVHDIYVQNNLLSGGAWPYRQADSGTGNFSGIQHFDGNSIVRGSFMPPGGEPEVCTLSSAPATFEQSGNQWSDGTPIADCTNTGGG
jgi:hypothetical protein